MPRYMLDTHMCIYLMKKQPKEVAERFSQCYVGDVIMSAITYAELEYGVAMSANPATERLNLASLMWFRSMPQPAWLMALTAWQPEQARCLLAPPSTVKPSPIFSLKFQNIAAVIQ